jgi:hypothetical protein
VARAAAVAIVAAAVAIAPVAAAQAPAPDHTSKSEAPRLAVLRSTQVLGDDGRPADDPDLLVLAGSLDALLADSAQDLGLTLDLGRRASGPIEEVDLDAQAQAAGGVLIVPSLRRREGEVELRLLLAEPDTRTLRSRVERVQRDDLAVRAVVMLRDLVTDRRDRPGPTADVAWRARMLSGTLTSPAPSTGRFTLALNTTLFGGLVGYSIQRASGSEDPRLLYPLLAVGAGCGLVSSILVAEEWNVGVGDAWFFSAGMLWPSLAAHLIWGGRFGSAGHEGDRWTAGLVGGTTGAVIATLGLTLRSMSDGGALLAHSGGGLGLVLGGVTEALVRGDIGALPIAGMGYGAGIGWLGAAALATQLQPSASRMAAVDLGALLGGLGGAALGSPLLIGDRTPTQQRAWVGMIGGMTFVGATAGYFLSRPKADEPPRRKGRSASVPLPAIGVIGESALGARRAPVMGVSWGGILP